jgi:hypothetical protein
VKQLKNNKTPGPDNQNPELIKYSGEDTANSISKLINKIFTSNTPLQATQISKLTVLNKPGKDPIPTNTRGITLQNTIRKVLELIILNRTRRKLESYLSKSQSATTNRSTADILWTYKWIKATTIKHGKKFYFQGLDLSKAFDTVNRTILLNILYHDVKLDESDFRLIKYTLDETKTYVQIQSNTSNVFHTTAGVPQGGALSLILFEIYIEYVLKQIRTYKPPLNPTDLYIETQFVDDLDTITTDGNLIYIYKTIIEPTFKQFNLTVNPDKEEFLQIEQHKLPEIKKLGSYLSEELDIDKKIQKTTFAFNTIKNIWNHHRYISAKTRLRIYNSIVLPILLYNIETLALTKQQLSELDTFHRKQLRAVLNIKYPVIIDNKKLYNITNSTPISILTIEKRWKLFGHILRSSPATPANIAAIYYFQNNIKNHGQKITLPKILHDDLSPLNLTLSNETDYIFLQTKALQRDKWQDFTKIIVDQHKIKEDKKRKANEIAQNIQPSRIRNQHYSEEQRRLYPMDINTPPGLDFRKKRRIQIGQNLTLYLNSPIARINEAFNDIMDINNL